MPKHLVYYYFALRVVYKKGLETMSKNSSIFLLLIEFYAFTNRKEMELYYCRLHFRQSYCRLPLHSSRFTWWHNKNYWSVTEKWHAKILDVIFTNQKENSKYEVATISIFPCIRYLTNLWSIKVILQNDVPFFGPKDVRHLFLTLNKKDAEILPDLK